MCVYTFNRNAVYIPCTVYFIFLALYVVYNWFSFMFF